MRLLNCVPPYLRNSWLTQNLILFSWMIAALIFLLFPQDSWAQSQTQVIQGTVIDKDNRQPLVGATVLVATLENPKGTTTDVDGNFVLEGIPVGRHTVRVQYIGYTTHDEIGVIVNSVKTTVLNIELVEEVFTTGEVVVTAFKNSNEPVNELAVVSGRSFSAEETERYAASVNDPGRMALSFPGVQQGGDDNENDIIIRGNSSVGMLWRLEGIDIPNPNHFARPGTSGGGVTVFSAQLLNRSDFYSGGMPAEYGNALSGAFDIHFRSGNMMEREHRVKIGLLGLDFMTEGPIKEKKSSYLVNYRYSTLGLLTGMGFYIVGDRVTNKFQDLSYNLTFQGKSGKDFITVFGLGGLSEEHYQPIYNGAERTPGEAGEWEDRLRNHDMAANGITYTRLIDDVSYFKAVVAVMGSYISYEDDTLDLSNVRYRYNDEIYKDFRLGTVLTYNRKLNQKLKWKSGLHVNQISYDYFKEEKPRSSSSDLDPNRVYGVSIDGRDNTQTVQLYSQFSYNVTPKLTVNAGAQLFGLMLTKDWAVDPRLSLKYDINPESQFSLAWGLYSQNVPLGTFFYTDENGVRPNLNLDLMKAQHLIGGYRKSFANQMIINLEAYYQRLYNVPIRPNGDDSYWMLNSRSGFPAFELESEGAGYNYGVDLVVEKTFSKGLFLLLTASTLESKYTANSGREYHTLFSTGFTTSSSIGKEFTVRGKNTLQIGGRLLYNGGYRFTPYDPIQSANEGRYIPMPNSFNASQVRPYFRIDSRISYRINKTKSASVISLDIQNVTNHPNPRGMGYNAITNSLEPNNHPSGFVPVISYQVDF